MNACGNGKRVVPDDDDLQILETPPLQVNQPQLQVNQPQEVSPQDNTNTPMEKKTRALTSDVWNDLVKIGLGADGKEKCKCKGCGKELSCRARDGTTHLGRHTKSCMFLKGKFGDVGDMHIDVEGKLKRKKFDQKANREIIAEMIITHGAPFNIVEWKVFRKYQKFMNEECKWISRNTIKADVMEIYKVEKEKLKSQLAQIPGRVCLTSDCWTSCTNNGYISLTAHFVDVNWKLNSKILAFSHLKPPHSGSQLALKVMELLREWGIDRKVFSLTLDNASANDNMQNYLKEHLGLICSHSDSDARHSNQAQSSFRGGKAKMPKSLYVCDEFEEHESQAVTIAGTSELEIYLSEQRLPPSIGFDILAYWKERSRRCPDLAKMACDVLSIPITTVASESAFSIGARVLNKYRSSLKDETVQALMCARSWLHGFDEYDSDSDEDEDKQEVIIQENMDFSQEGTSH